jgi:hypothetical protein
LYTGVVLWIGLLGSSLKTLQGLLLRHVQIEPAPSTFGHLLSASCCPRLWRLRLEYFTWLSAPPLRCPMTIEELGLHHVRDNGITRVVMFCGHEKSRINFLSSCMHMEQLPVAAMSALLSVICFHYRACRLLNNRFGSFLHIPIN